MYSTADYHGHAAPDVPGRRPQAPGHLHAAGRAARRAAARARDIPAVPLLGPGAPTSSPTRWIAARALRVLERAAADAHARLPAAPRLRPAAPRAVASGDRAPRSRAVDALCGELIERGATRRGRGRRAVRVRHHRGLAPVHVNRALREAGCSRCATSSAASCSTPAPRDAFAVADHQVAHVYVARPELVPEVAALLRELPGVERVLDADGKRAAGLDHPRSGELVAIADARTLVHLLLLARRRARARLRAHRRHPPQARLRPGRAVPRPAAQRPRSCASACGSRRRCSASAT